MKRINRYIITLFAIALFTNCKGFLDVNTDPDTPTSVPINQELPVLMFYAAQLNYDHTEYGVFLSQALTTGGRSQTGSLPYRSGWEFLSINRNPQWRRHYYDIGENFNQMNTVAEKQGAYNYILIGRTIRLMSTLFTTDMFGDMPLTDAYKSIAPKYDTQESIYQWMYDEVDELIKLYNDPSWVQASSNKPITADQDRIFGGDLNKWKRFTYGLKARIYLRKLPNMDTSPQACQTIIDAVDSALVNWQEPDYNYPGGSGEKNCPWGPAQPVINSWESRANLLDQAIPTKYLCVNIMGVFNTKNPLLGWAADPRLEKIMTPRPGPTGTNDTQTKPRYVESNFGIDASYTVTQNYPDLFSSTSAPKVFTSNTSYISLMLTEELLLMKAEAQYWKGNKDDAWRTTVEAATDNMTRHGVIQRLITSYLANANYLPQSGFNIGHLMRQKYVCMYLQPEMWTDMRRYKYSNDDNQIKYDGVTVYPGLRRPYNLYTPYWGDNQNWVQRINYDPETEEKYNRSELERLGAFRNPAWLWKPMIWAQ